MPKRIVFTRPDGSVSVCAPSLTALRFMTNGGGRWDGFPPGFLDRQIAKQAEECGERSAHRFVMAMQFGGCTDAEAYALMRDRFCAPLGTGCELWDTADVPTDRWFRNAWVRSHNGGPIDVCLKKAKPIQFQRIKAAVDLENNRRESNMELFGQPVVMDWGRIREQIRAAATCDDLRLVWPGPSNASSGSAHF